MKMMKKIIFALIVLSSSISVDAKHVNGYRRRDGTYVSSYERGSNKNNFPIELISVGIIIVVGIAIYIGNAIQNAENEKKRERLAQIAKINYSKWANYINQIGYLPIKSVNLALQKDEVGYLQVNNAILYEPKSIRNSVHTGGAIRIAKGITVGRGYSTSESHEEWRPISTGTVYITNKRVIFDGDMQNRAVTIKSLISVQTGDIQVAITSSSRQKTMLFDNVNGQIIGKVIELIQSGNCEN